MGYAEKKAYFDEGALFQIFEPTREAKQQRQDGELSAQVGVFPEAISIYTIFSVA